MPEAVKEVVTEAPQAVLENSPEKLPCKEVKPAEASSGTLPAVEEPSKDEGEGAVAPDLGQGEAPEQGKSETVNAPEESGTDGSAKVANSENISSDSAGKEEKPENSNNKVESNNSEHSSEGPKETVSDESQDSKLPSPEEGGIEECKQASPEQSKTIETESSNLTEPNVSEKILPEESKKNKGSDLDDKNEKNNENSVSQKNDTEGNNEKMDAVENDNQEKVSVAIEKQIDSDKSSKKAESSSVQAEKPDSKDSSDEAVKELNTVSEGEKVLEEAKNQKTDVSEKMETTEGVSSEKEQSDTVKEDSKEKPTELLEKKEPDSETSAESRTKTDSLVINSSEEASSKQEKDSKQSEKINKEGNELVTNENDSGKPNNVNTPQGESNAEGPGGSKEIDADAAEEVKRQTREGKGLLIMGDFFGAADILGKACETAGKLYGELANENAELYYLYGWSMLECAKNENNVLGEGVKDKEDDEESDEAVNGDEAMETEENGDVQEEETMTVDEDKSEKDKETKEDGEKDESKQTSPENKEETKENGISKESEEEEEEDTSLKVAWEMLELAKITFGRLGNNERLADTYIKLGEVGIESGHPTALEDMKSALELRKKCCANNLRLISETHFNLGLGLATFEFFDEAIEQFKLSKSLLEDKINLLSKSEEQKAQEEIKEIKDLLPDLDEKMQDMEDSKVAKNKAQALNGTDKPVVESGESSKKPVSNISHLVKRKRKLEDVTSDLLPNTKQPCTDKTDPEKSA